MAEDQIDIKFGAQIGGLVAGVDAVKEQIAGLAEPVREISRSFFELREALYAAFAIDRVVEWTERITEMGEATLHAAETLGIAVPKLSALNSAFAIAGEGADLGRMAIMRLERAASEAQKGGLNQYADAFRRLGISVTDAAGHVKSGEELLMELADRVKDAPNDINKLDVMWQIFGRGLGENLLPVLDKGRAGLQALMDEARSTGAVIDTGMARQMDDARESAHELGQAFMGLGVAIEEKLGFFKAFADALTRITEELTRALNATDQAKLDNLSAKLIQLRERLAALQQPSAADSFDKWINPEAFEQNKRAIEKQIAELLPRIAELQQRIAGGAGPVNASGTNPIGPPEASSGGAEGGDKGTDLTSQADALEKELNALLRQRIELIQGAAQVSDAYYTRLAADAKLALTQGKTSAADELATQRALAAEKYGLDMKALADEERLYGQDEARYQQIEDKKKELTQRYLTAVDQLNEQAAQKERQQQEQTAREFNQIFAAPVTRAFDGMVQGILQGTQTWQQALDKAFSNVAISFIEEVTKMIAQWLVFEAVTEAGSMMGFAAAGASLGMSAGPLGGIVSGAMSLFSGGGGGIGALAGLASFDVGAWSVPSTMAAIVHAGEMIIPADIASGLRSGAGAPGGMSAPNFNINVSALDARSVQQIFNNPMTGRMIANIVQRYLPE